MHTEQGLESQIEPPKYVWVKDTTQAMRKPGGRDLADYKEFLGFNESELKGLTVLDLGSGSKEKLSQQLKGAGIEADVFSLNPDYGLKSRKYRRIIHNEEGWQRKSVAALAQALPFRDKSFDRIYGLGSVTYYADAYDHPDDAKRWASEIARVLKPDGEARLGDILGFKGRKQQEAYQSLIAFLNSLGLEAWIEEFKVKEKEPKPRYRLVIYKPLEQ